GELPPMMLQTFGFTPTVFKGAPDAALKPYVGDNGTMYVWNSGANTLTIGFNPDEKAARWTATINGTFYEGTSPQHVYKPVGPMPGDSKLTQALVNQIRGGMTSAEVANLLGRATFSGLPADGDNRKFVGDKGKVDKWIDGANVLNVAYNPDGKAARWSGTINN